ncbi:MAG: BamA/TamA family outer membrane protein [Myxococcota bacterium]|nr:BamA/TamA family outer membrane protein [Myxococcota bacterium]
MAPASACISVRGVLGFPVGRAAQPSGSRAAPLARSAVGVLVVFGVSASACAKLPPGQLATDALSIRGAHALDSGAIEEKLATQESPKFLGLFEGVIYDYDLFNHATFQRDLARVERYYRDHGYYSAHARAGRVIATKPGHVRVEIVVEEGEPIVQRELVVEGLQSVSPAIRSAVEAAARSALPKNTPFTEEKALASEQEARKALSDRGYAYATVKRDSYLDIVHRRADTTLTVTPGEPATFGPVLFQGLDPDAAGPRVQQIPEAPLRRAMDIKEGEPYSTTRIEAAAQALRDFEIFSSVSIVPDLSLADTHVVPLTVRAEPSNLRQVRLGGGIEFDTIRTELHLVAGWEDHNFLGGLRDLSVDLTPGMVFYPLNVQHLVKPTDVLLEERLRVQLRQPSFLEAETEAFVRPELNVFPLLVNPRPPESDPVVGYGEFKGAAGLDRTFLKRLFVSLSYVAQVEDPFNYKGTPDPALQTLVIAYPELIAHLDFRDDSTHPHAGFYLGNDLQIAGGVFGGSAQDVRVVPEVRAYLPVGRKTTFATRASVGFLFASNYGDVVQNHLNDAVTAANRSARVRDVETVLFRGFFSGGPTSNRGYPVRGVAPHGVVPFLNPGTAVQQLQACPPPKAPDYTPPNPETCSSPIGGFTLWELSNELRFAVRGPLSGALFCDMGDVSPHQYPAASAFRLDHLHLSCGAGLRYDTPVGPIRLDVGYRIPPLQVLGFTDERQAYRADPTNGFQSPFFGTIPMAIAIGIGEAY